MATKRKKPAVVPCLSELERVRDAGKKRYKNAKRTDDAYLGYIKRGKEFVAKVVEGRRKAENDEPALEWGIKTDKIALAFENPPNEHSALMLEHWIVQKCFNEDLGQSTADGIHAAFVRYWDNMAQEKFRGPYKLDDETGSVTGNPARAACIEDLMKTIKHKCGANGAHRNHAEAMKIEDMRKIMVMSEAKCSPELRYEDLGDAGKLKIIIEHMLMRAFLTSGFTLWTRNFELCGLQRKHIALDCVGPAPYHIPHFKVRLENRKGWQKRVGQDGPLEGNTYEIYEQPKLPEIDMFRHFLVWLSFLEEGLGRKLEPNDYVFPYIGVNGVLYPKKEMTHDVIQKLLADFAEMAGLQAHFTTHSLRRGGSQYRFMFAPLGERWSLSIIRWWGGWAVGEHVDTLIKYLVDSLQAYESGHGDALRPIQTEADRSFCGDHVLMNVVTAAEVRQFAASTDRKLSLLMDTFGKLTGLASSCNVRTANAHLEMTTIQCDASRNDVPKTSSVPPVKTVPPKPLPIQNVQIPNIRRGPNAWKDAVKQWEEDDPVTGSKALKDWPEAWYTGSQRVLFAAKRMQRGLIAAEYDRLNRNDDAFKAAYPEAAKGIKEVLRAINAARIDRGDAIARKSKNGQPHERRERQSPVIAEA